MIVRVAVIWLCGFLVACSDAPSEFSVDDAWARPMPPVSNVSAIYAVLDNPTDSTVWLVGASSSRCAEMRVHETTIDDGVMSMDDVGDAGVVIAPASAVSMEPNGLHLMCLGTDAAFLEGETVEVTLEFEAGDRSDPNRSNAASINTTLTISTAVSIEQR